MARPHGDRVPELCFFPAPAAGTGKVKPTLHRKGVNVGKLATVASSTFGRGIGFNI